MSLEQKKLFLKTELIPPGILTYTIEGKKKQVSTGPQGPRTLGVD